MRRLILCGLFIVLLTGVVYARVGGYGLVWDDRDYISDNVRVAKGLTGEGIAWAFGSFHVANWHPLTWISLMSDVSIFGSSTAAHHLVNVSLHAINALLLFLVLVRMTGRSWPSCFAAALFAVHPLHVESVAWVTERKDVLSGFFMLLTLGAYLRFVARRGPVRYLAVVMAFAAGLMAKPMLVTLPFILLLLDAWPLGRLGGFTGPAGASGPRWGSMTGAVSCLVEKLPLLGLTVASCVITIQAQHQYQAMQSLISRPMESRIANALVVSVRYLGKTFWPRTLAVHYPYETVHLISWQAGAAALLLICISALAILNLRRRPYLGVGWFWYLGTLVPVIGFVSVGSQAMADRYAYLPLLGVYLMLSWLMLDLSKKLPHRRALPAMAGVLALAALMARTANQVEYWRDEPSLYEHALRVTRDSALMNYNLAGVRLEQGRPKEAIPLLREALRIEPFNADALANLGVALLKTEKRDEAQEYFERALKIKPDQAVAHVNLGSLLAAQGRRGEAIERYRRAIGLEPGMLEAHINLGNALDEEGRSDEAVAAYNDALRIKPDDAFTHYNLGVSLAGQGRRKEAAAHYREALRLRPNMAEARRALEALLSPR